MTDEIEQKKVISIPVCDPDEGIDYVQEVIVHDEWMVPCRWCGSDIGEPCYERVHPYHDKVHEIRKEDYQKMKE